MRGNEPLRSAVNSTLSSAHKTFLIERQQGLTAARNAKAEAKHAVNVQHAKVHAEKTKNSEAK